MSMNTQGRPTGTGTSGFASTSGSSLLPNEPLLFEIGDTEHSGVDLPDVEIDESRLGGFARRTPLDLAGLTEPEAATHGDIDVYVARFRPMMNTLSTKTERTILKLIVGANGGKVLGVHILGPGAAEMIQLVAIPIGMGATKADFDRAMAMHPTAAEELVTFKAPTYTYRNGAKV